MLLSRLLLAALFIAAGTLHFARPDFYVRIMPPWLPYHVELVYLSGAFEIGLGLLLLFPNTTRLAAWGLIALLIAVFPANLHMALNPDLFPLFPAWLLYLRLPLQGLLIWWASGFTRAAFNPSPENR